MRIIRQTLFVALTAATAAAQELPWSIAPKPLLVLGDANDPQATLFGAGLVGATRLPNGNILVADRGDYSLRVFDPSGKLVKSLARKGVGPGEATFLAKLWRCGSEIVIYDIEGYRTTVFGTDLSLKRSFRFGVVPGQRSTPYMSACNANGTFVHNGWEKTADMKGGVFRSTVPIWLSGVDSSARHVGEMLGSERWGLVIDGKFRGTRPLPLGKQPVIAIGTDRFYIGTADTYTITMHDLTGRPIGTFGKPNVQLATTDADIELAVDMEAAGQSDEARARLRKSYEAMQLPKTVPAYQSMLVDAEGAVWVRDYPRAKSAWATWTVFSRDGKPLAAVQLPMHLTVFEIGRDYVLGRYVDPAEDIPEVRLYRLRR
jgi:hypothetical protein